MRLASRPNITAVLKVTSLMSQMSQMPDNASSLDSQTMQVIQHPCQCCINEHAHPIMNQLLHMLKRPQFSFIEPKQTGLDHCGAEHYRQQPVTVLKYVVPLMTALQIISGTESPLETDKLLCATRNEAVAKAKSSICARTQHKLLKLVSLIYKRITGA